MRRLRLDEHDRCCVVAEAALGALLLCDIDANRVASYQARRKSQGASARTLNKELQVLRQVLKRYKLWANLQGDVKFERESEHIGQALTREQEASLLEACEANSLLHTVVTLALNTALRKNEIRTLRWNQIDLFKRTLTVGKTKTDAGSGRLIPLNAPAYRALVKWASRFPEAKPDDYVFPACEDARLDCPKPDAGKIDPSRPIKSWRTAWRRALKEAGLSIRFHNLRHTCITKLAEGQASEQTLMAMRATSAGRCSNTTATSEWRQSVRLSTPSRRSLHRQFFRPVCTKTCTNVKRGNSDALAN